MPQFTITNRKSKEKKIVNLNQETIVIGRLKTCDIHLEATMVSRKHAEIVFLNGDFFLVDLESGNGTEINGKKIRPHEKTLLKNGDIIEIENFNIAPHFEETSHDNISEEKTDAGILEIKMIKKVLSKLDADKDPSLETMDENIPHQKILFTDDLEELVIGRDPKCHMKIESDVISRRHAVLHKKWGGMTITDLKSKNGTFVNDKRENETIVKDGDIIMLGNIRLLFRHPQDIDYEALSREYEKDESLLGDDSIKPGELPKKAGIDSEVTDNMSSKDGGEGISPQAKMSVGEEIPKTAADEKDPIEEEKNPSIAKKPAETPKRKLKEPTVSKSIRQPTKSVLSKAEKTLLFIGIILVILTSLGLWFLLK